MPKADLILLHPPTVYDFRQRATLWGPISDVVPSTPIFEMYPIGFATLTEYLERHGFRTRIVNLAVRMLRDPDFDAEALIASLDAACPEPGRRAAFGIDLHWLAHAQGALEVARLVKQHHPDAPLICGGFSATYFHHELVRYPQVDYVLRGDSTEEPLRRLMEHILAGSEPKDVPNLTWKDEAGIHANPQTYIPTDLDHLAFDYRQMVRAVTRDRAFFDYVPFDHWVDYPIMANFAARGCTEHCTICGGSAFASRHLSGRSAPAYRSPERLAEDVRNAARISRGPAFILCDLRQAGMDYARRFFRAIQGHAGPVMLEFFWPVDRAYAEELAAALPNFVVEFSPESHDPAVRRAAGKRYSNVELEETIENCLAVGCRRFDLFFMIGLPQQTPASALETVDYCEHLLTRFDDGRLIPFTAPLAPFLDPGSLAYEYPDRFGYIRHCFTLEDHRRALLAPTWKHILSYETRWMSRDDIAAVTYEAGRRLNRLKAHFGLVSPEVAAETEERIRRAVALMAQIERLVARCTPEEREQELLALKPQIDRANTSTLCDKAELDLPVGPVRFNVPQLVGMVVQDGWAVVRSRLPRLTPRRRREPAV